MAGLIEELQRDALDASVSVEALLRRVQLAAVRLELHEVDAWTRNELGGYKAYLPDYRKVTGQLRMWNLYHGWVPVLIQQEELASNVSTVPFPQPIGTLINLVRRKEKRDGTLRYALTPGQVRAFNGIVGHGSAARYTVHLTRSHVVGILDRVRSMILDWAVRVQQQDILGEGMSFSAAETARAREAVSRIHIGGIGKTAKQIGEGNSGGLRAAQTASDSSVFQALTDVVQVGVSVPEERERILAAIKGMERNRSDRNAFGAAYAMFISTAAEHMLLISPFMTALAHMLTH